MVQYTQSMVMETIALLIVGLVMISKGADWFVESAVVISEKSGIPKIIIGATIVSFATTSPEFAVSVTAAYIGHTDLSVGNAVGSVICNTALILGLIVSIKAMPVDKHGFVRKGAFMLLSGILLILLTIDRQLSSVDGLILLTVFMGFLYYNYKLQRRIFSESDGGIVRAPMGDMKKEFLLFIGGAGLVILGSRILIDSGVTLAELLGVPEMIIGLTLVAFGTSLPELITALSSTLKGHQDISIGNILGANIMNITLVLGASSQIRTLDILDQSVMYDFPVMLFIMVLLMVFGITGRKLARWEGAVILTTYVAYIAGLFIFFR